MQQSTDLISNELLIEILEYSEEAVAVVDQSTGLVIYANRALSELFGLPAEKILQQPLPVATEPGPILEVELEPGRFNRRASDRGRMVEVRNAFALTNRDLKIIFFRDRTALQTMKQELRSLTLKDELTHLFNRPTFIRFGEHQLDLGQRMKKQMVVLRVRLLGLPEIKQRFGSKSLDAAVQDLAGILVKTFRKSDLLARIAEDEFAVLAVNSLGIYQSVIVSRLKDNLVAFCSSEQRPYPLQICCGTSWFDPEAPRDMEALLAAISFDDGNENTNSNL
jgi:diguanylate cyclase (GGDEF)-like protein/PAS domain S-box-containing protein